jgi:hypothetical protein
MGFMRAQLFSVRQRDSTKLLLPVRLTIAEKRLLKSSNMPLNIMRSVKDISKKAS